MTDCITNQSINSDKHLPQSSFTGQFFRWRRFALVSLKLISPHGVYPFAWRPLFEILVFQLIINPTWPTQSDAFSRKSLCCWCRGSALRESTSSSSSLWSSPAPLYQVHSTVHPQNVGFQNVRFQNVRFQNVWNVRFTKCQVYKTSGLQNGRFTKRQVFKTSGWKKTSIYILYLWLVEIRRFCCSHVCRKSDGSVLFSILEAFCHISP